jgi:predicted DNA-binding protein (MmcQ/YjbR family)
MTLDECNNFCASLPHVHHVIQWGNSDVWKIRAKVFAVARAGEQGFVEVSFKCSRMSFDLLKDQDGLRPAPYMASRGMTWIQYTSDGSLDDDGLKAYLKESYRLASLNLPKTEQKQLGLNQA